MKRPGPVGLTLVVAFGAVFAIEFRTILVMLGIGVSAEVYYPVAIGALVVILVTLLALPENDSRGATVP